MLAAPSAAQADVCKPRPSVYLGAIKGADDLADRSNIADLATAANTGFYFTSYAMTVSPGLTADLGKIRDNFASHYGIIEVGTSPAQMPDVASRFARYLDKDHHWTWGDAKGATWPDDVAKAGWRPDIALLNPFGMADVGPSDPYYQMNLLAIADVKKASPGIRHVLPFATPNGRPLKPEDHDLNWTDPAWKESAALAEAAGGLGLDTPSNYFMTGREEAYRSLVAQEIRWANQRGLVSVVLASPYALGAGGSNGPDHGYLQATQQMIAYLHRAGADPTIYVAANYAEAEAAIKPGKETGPDTISQVALWLAKNAPTTPFPASWRSDPRQACEHP